MPNTNLVLPVRSPTWTFLVLLVAADLAFVFCHVVYVETNLLRGRAFSLEADGGLPEAFQYVKQFWIAAITLIVARRTRLFVYLSWSAVFLFLLLDDALQFHEQAGLWLAQRYALPGVFSLRPEDLGELLFAAAVGAAMLVLVGFAVLREGAAARSASRDLVILIVLLAVLGVLLDMLHVIAHFKGSLTAQLLLIIEDGGEMVVISAIAAYAFDLALYGRPRLDLWSTLRRRALAMQG